MFRTSTLRIALILALAIPSALAAEARPVEIETGDGITLAGTLWQEDESAPGVLLLHQCNADRSMYEELGAKLAGAGFRVLAIDFRGFGESQDGARASFPADVEAAYQFLSGGAGEVFGALGASCGGSEVIKIANAHAEIRRLGFLSAGLSAIDKRDAMRLTSQLLLIASKGDPRAAESAGTIAYRARSRAKLLLYDGNAHGYPLFEQDPELIGKIVAWFSAGLDP